MVAMKAEIISVGTELLLGEITDTNASYLAQQLSLLGIDLYWISQVGDNRARLLEVLRRAWGRSELILLTGGLGPTDDDLTREAIADLLGEEMVVDPELERWLREAFSSFRLNMPLSNLKQATLIRSAQSVPNPLGTAPGWWVEREGRLIVAMPGVPQEMRRMWEDQILPRLRPYAGTGVLVTRTLKVMGKGESEVEQDLHDFVASANPTLATYAKADGIHVRLAAKATEAEEAQRMLDELEGRVRAILGSFIYGVDDESLAQVVGRILLEQGLTLATMESFTGGHLANAITDVPGSSSYFRGGMVAYTRETKEAWGVSRALLEQHGTVHPQVSLALARVARERLGADLGVGITGVAGPEPLEGQPPGTMHIAVDNRGETRLSSSVYPRARPDVKRVATLRALNLVRRSLLGLP
jgi:nicotinamide-nucleotide amidase